jgi:hypothetical protein
MNQEKFLMSKLFQVGAVKIMDKEYKNYLEKLILSLSIGLIDGIKSDVISIRDAERLLFSPRTLAWLKQLKLDKQIINLIHMGTEIEDIESLLPERLHLELSKISRKARKLLLKNKKDLNFNCSTLDEHLFMKEDIKKKGLYK